MKILKHGDLITINGRRGTVGTIGGYAAQYNENPNEALRKFHARPDADTKMNPKMWVNQESVCICSDPGYYEAQRVKWANAIELQNGDLVWIDGELRVAIYAGDYSDMVHFNLAS